MFGLSVGNVITLPALIVQREFDAASFRQVIGLVSMVGYTVLAFGPTLLGPGARHRRIVRRSVGAVHRFAACSCDHRAGRQAATQLTCGSGLEAHPGAEFWTCGASARNSKGQLCAPHSP